MNAAIEEVHSELTEDLSTGTTTIMRDNDEEWSFYITEPLISDVSVTIVAFGDTDYLSLDLSRKLIALDEAGQEVYRTPFICLGNSSDKDVRLFVGSSFYHAHLFYLKYPLIL